MKDYLLIIFLGIAATFLYNYFANLLRAIGNSVVPLAFLAVSAILNVILDLVCVLVLDWGVKGAAVATVFSQYVSGVGIGLYTLKKFPQLCPKRTDCTAFNRSQHADRNTDCRSKNHRADAKFQRGLEARHELFPNRDAAFH